MRAGGHSIFYRPQKYTFYFRKITHTRSISSGILSVECITLKRLDKI